MWKREGEGRTKERTAAKRVSKGDSTSPEVNLVLVDTDVSDRHDGLAGERLVDLVEVDFVFGDSDLFGEQSRSAIGGRRERKVKGRGKGKEEERDVRSRAPWGWRMLGRHP